MSTHTPEPWTRRGWGIYDANGRFVAEIGGELKMDADRANAQLIAAAPDLLAACEALLTIAVETGHGMSDAAIVAHTAIEKARDNV